MQKNNKGYSLIELVVVVAIMAVLTSVVAYSYGIVSGKEARQCAGNISTALDKAKNYAMAKSGSSDAYLLIRKDSAEGWVADYYFPDSAVSGGCHWVEKEKLGKKAVEVECELTSGTRALDETTGICIYFNRITGAFKEAKLVTVQSDGSINGVIETAECKTIRVKRGKVYEITCTIATGKNEVERVS